MSWLQLALSLVDLGAESPAMSWAHELAPVGSSWLDRLVGSWNAFWAPGAHSLLARIVSWNALWAPGAHSLLGSRFALWAPALHCGLARIPSCKGLPSWLQWAHMSWLLQCAELASSAGHCGLKSSLESSEKGHCGAKAHWGHCGLKSSLFSALWPPQHAVLRSIVGPKRMLSFEASGPPQHCGLH